MTVLITVFVFIYKQGFYCDFCQTAFFPLSFHLQPVKNLGIEFGYCVTHYSLKCNTLSSPSIPFPPPCINNQLPANS